MIDDLGLGSYQFHVWILCSSLLAAESFEMHMIAVLVPALEQEFLVVSHLGKAMLMTWTFIGLALGTVVSGPLADAFGRRLPMAIGCIGGIVSQLGTLSATHLDTLYFFRAICGFWAGLCIPAAYITIAEVFPSEWRACAFASTSLITIIGDLWLDMGFATFMPDLFIGNWRLIVCWGMVPIIGLALFALRSPVVRHDTPFYLGSQDREAELQDTINLIADMNGKPDLKVDVQDRFICHQPEGIQLSKLPETLCRKSLFIMCFLCIVKDLYSWGFTVFWPQVLARVPGLGSFNAAQELMITSAISVPGIILGVFLVKILPRRLGVFFIASTAGICMIFLKGIEQSKPSAFLAVAVFKLFTPAWGSMTWLLPGEIFGTRVRGLCTSTATFCGRFGAMAAPFLVELGTESFTLVLAVLGFAAACIVHMLPDTTNCKLSEDMAIDDSDLQHLARGEASYGAAETLTETAKV